MKRFVSFFVVALFCITSFAQTKATHLSFKGVPIDGKQNEFVARMKEAGFSYFANSKGTVILKGDFAGFKNCLVGVSTLHSSDIVNKITVRFPSHDKWKPVEEDYRELKSMLTKKYGKPSSCVEKFQGSVIESSDIDKFVKLISEGCNYETIFVTANGKITLSMECLEPADGYVRLVYRDKVNTEIVKKKALDDL